MDRNQKNIDGVWVIILFYHVDIIKKMVCEGKTLREDMISYNR